ncbi:MAG: type III polyketide synthase [Actinomycetota bacterium]|nr:type III polyketide synthase [Actinomycetota bacterium]
MSPAIIGVGTAFPPAMDQQEAWDGFFSSHFSSSRAAGRIWRSAGVERRHAVVDPRSEDLSRASTAQRMSRFLDEALPLGKGAVNACLADARLSPADVDLFAVVSCTGYATPGLDMLLARDLGMPPSLERLHVGHMGCYAALPALAAVADAAAARRKVGVLLCVELTSLHLQPPTDELDQIVAHALFSDGAAAVAVHPGAAGLELVDVMARTDMASAGEMGWHITDLGFRMTLSSRVSAVLAEQVVDTTTGLLARNGLGVEDVAHWAIHPGGPRIVSTVADRLGLSDQQVAPSRQVLRQHGNCSSATVLIVLGELLRARSPSEGEHIVAMAFGPGLTLYMALLRVGTRSQADRTGADRGCREAGSSGAGTGRGFTGIGSHHGWEQTELARQQLNPVED